MSAMLASAFTGCTDDHFDINPDVLGKSTIWENIKSNPELSEYADILQSVYFSKNEQKTTPETYAQVLDGEQNFTVWAPVNGSFRYSYYKGLLNSNNRDSIYKVEKELIRNNMTRYAHIANSTDSLKIELFNDKAAWLNYDKMTVKSAKMTTPNIGSSNGVLHVVDKPIPYQYNLYEYMATRDDLSEFNSFIKSYQTIKFNEFASTPGPTVNGVITYVDSITYISNDYTEKFLEAYLEKEDSNYVMIMPTNNAWNKTLAKTQKYFKYKPTYKQDVNTQTETGKDTLIEGATTSYTDAELDSIVNLRTKNAICQRLSFNANWQYEQIPITSISDIRKADARKDSLRTTNGMKFKKTGTLNETNRLNTLEIDNYADIFGNADPVETSNGYAYVVDEFNFPSTVYAPIQDYRAAEQTVFESADNQCSPSNRSITYWNFIPEKPDSSFRINYFVLGPKSSTSNPGAFFRLKDALSAKYDIFVVIGYNYEYNLQNKFRAYISYDTEDKRITNEVLKNPNEGDIDAKGSSIYNTNYFVNRPMNDESGTHITDTICIAKDFEFPVCYYGINNAYPVIQIKSNFTSSEKAYYSREIWVQSIILKAKED